MQHYHGNNLKKNNNYNYNKPVKIENRERRFFRGEDIFFCPCYLPSKGAVPGESTSSETLLYSPMHCQGLAPFRNSHIAPLKIC